MNSELTTHNKLCLIMLVVVVLLGHTLEFNFMCDDYIQGVEDCKQGNPAPLNASDEYYNGYGHQYELEQIQTARTDNETLIQNIK